MTFFSSICKFFIVTIRSTLFSKRRILIFSAIGEERKITKLTVKTFDRSNIQHKLKFLGYLMVMNWENLYYSNFHKKNRLKEWTLKSVAENSSFRCDSAEKWENLNFLKNWNGILLTTLCVSITSWLRYSILLFSYERVDIQANSKKVALIQHCSALKTESYTVKKIGAWTPLIQNWFSLEQCCLALISAESFSCDQRWFRKSQSWSALKGTDKCCKRSNLRNSTL